MKSIRFFTSSAVLLLLTSILLQNQVKAQSITSARDGTGTFITPNGDRYDITSGQVSRDGANLFHSFQQFGLNQGEVANFISNPNIQNILGRVVGGNPSVINGLIQVTGSNANLFLLNPAGIVFGTNASLNVPASFTATTANGIGFGDKFFDAIANNNYADLLGNPNSFAFTAQQPGAIANAGNLSVNSGQNLTLLAGTTINTGQLSAPKGEILVAAVKGENLLRLSQAGTLLSLEFQPLTKGQGNFSAMTLPQLLTTPAVQNATAIAVNTEGRIQLTGSGIGVTASTGMTLVGGSVNVWEGKVGIFGEKVGLFAANINASGTNSGGRVLIGGDYKGEGFVPNALFTYISPDTLINADALNNGNGGRVIVWADDTTRFYGRITARGGSQGGNGGFVETSGKNILNTLGGEVDASATQGQAGSWLLDPRNVIIANSSSGGSFSGGNPNIFTPVRDDVTVDTTTIVNALNNGTDVIITTGSAGGQKGNITVSSPIERLNRSGSPATLTLDAANNINVNAPIFAGEARQINVVFKAEGAVNINAKVEGNIKVVTPSTQQYPRQINSNSTITPVNNLIEPSPINNPTIQPINNPTNPTPVNPSQPIALSNIVKKKLRRNSENEELDPKNVNAHFAPANPTLADLHIAVDRLEQKLTGEFEKHLNLSDNLTPVDTANTGEILSKIESSTGVKPAVIYLNFEASPVASQSHDRLLEVILVTAKGQPIRKLITGATRGEVLKVAQEFIQQVTDARKVNTDTYLASSQKLYNWFIAPLETELAARKISNISFIAETGLRLIPVAALHDGKQFLVEKYSTGLMPSMSLTDHRYIDLKQASVLAMGASKFKDDDQEPLPSVPLELKAIANDIWKGQLFLNQDFTLANLKVLRQQQPYGIIHLATHGKFEAGALRNSYIQLWDTKLRLDQIRQLGWNNPPVQLLVLSACQTAIGNQEAELGFAGLAVQAGVKSALASLWNVSDTGTLGLMMEFYRQLKTAPIKAEALRQAQIAMLQGKVSDGEDSSFAHPYYWAAFTTIGSPW